MRLFVFDLDRERRQFEEFDVALLDRALVHHVARDAQEPHLDVRRGGLLLGDLVQFEGEIPAEHVDAVGLGRVLAGADGAPELGRDLRHVADAHRRIDRADMDHAAGFDAVQPRVAVQRRCVGELQDELDVSALALRRLLAVASPNSAPAHTCRSYLPRF